jgi:hypothetical protein
MRYAISVVCTQVAGLTGRQTAAVARRGPIDVLLEQL